MYRNDHHCASDVIEWGMSAASAGRHGVLNVWGTDRCITTYATKLLGSKTDDNDDWSQLLMDVIEVVDASGYSPPVAVFTQYEELASAGETTTHSQT